MKLLDLLLLGECSNGLYVRPRDETLYDRIKKGGLLEGGLLSEIPGVGFRVRGLPLFRSGRVITSPRDGDISPIYGTSTDFPFDLGASPFDLGVSSLATSLLSSVPRGVAMVEVVGGRTFGLFEGSCTRES